MNKQASLRAERNTQKCKVFALSVPMISKTMRWEIFAFKLKNTMFEILNIQAKLLTTQYIGTCKSAYTKGYALN